MKARKSLSKLRNRQKKLALTRDSAAPENKAASERFLQDLVIRGEAAEPAKGGKLHSQATHAITKKNPDGTLQVKRARFKLA